jgi:hypothetical protein
LPADGGGRRLADRPGDLAVADGQADTVDGGDAAVSNAQTLDHQRVAHAGTRLLSVNESNFPDVES